MRALWLFMHIRWSATPSKINAVAQRLEPGLPTISERVASSRCAYSYDASATVLLVEGATGFAVAWSIFAPRGSFIWLGLWGLVLGCMWLVSRAREGDLFDDVPGNRATALTGGARTPTVFPFVSVFAFAAFALASTAWSVAPDVSAGKAVRLLALALASFAIALIIAQLSSLARWHLARGLVHGLLIGAAYVTLEYWTGGALKLAIIQQTGLIADKPDFHVSNGAEVVGINPLFLNRSLLALSLWACVAGLAMCVWRPPRFGWVTLIFGSLIALLIFAGESESAKLAFVAGVGVAGAASLARDLTRRVAIIGAVAGVVLMPVIVAHVLPSPERVEGRLFYSAVDRLYIWKTTAARIWDAPLVGHGTNVTSRLNRAERPAVGAAPRTRLSTHAHNAYLQVWFELGAIGAGLLALVVIAGFGALSATAGGVQPFAIGYFAAVLSAAGVAYGFWQLWLLALYALSAMMVAGLLGTPTMSDDSGPGAHL